MDNHSVKLIIIGFAILGGIAAHRVERDNHVTIDS